TVKQGSSNNHVESVLADRDGSVWLATSGGLHRWNNGQITIPRTRSGNTDGKFNGHSPSSLFQDDRGRIWVSTFGGIGYLENDSFNSVSGIPGGGAMLSVVQDKAGNLWVDNEKLGLFELYRDGEMQQITWAALGHKDHASVLAADPLQGGIWIGFF